VDAVPPTLDARAERHLASVAGSTAAGSGTGEGPGSMPGSAPGAGTVTGPVAGSSGRGGVTAGGMPMRTRTAPHAQPTAAPAAPRAEGAAAASPRGAVPFPHPRTAGTSAPPSDPRPTAPPAGPRTGGSGSGRLPRRVRQAHLAPQLRERPQDADGERAGREAERRPEQARSMLAALRDGTRRARAEEDVPTPAWPSSLRGDAPRPQSQSPRGGAPRPASPRDETPAPTWNTAPPERRQLPTRPRPTRNTP
jgi:hypothetical protein